MLVLVLVYQGGRRQAEGREGEGIDGQYIMEERQRTLANSFASPPLELIFRARRRRERLEMSGCYWMDCKRMVTCRVGPWRAKLPFCESDPGRAVFVGSSVASVLVPTMLRRCLRVKELRESRDARTRFKGSRRGGAGTLCCQLS